METPSLLSDLPRPQFSHQSDLTKDILDTIENVLMSNENVPGRDLEELARGYDKLGTLKHRLIGDILGAIKSHQQSMIVRETHIGDHVDTVSSLTNIGCLYFEMQ